MDKKYCDDNRVRAKMTLDSGTMAGHFGEDISDLRPEIRDNNRANLRS